MAEVALRNGLGAVDGVHLVIQLEKINYLAKRRNTY